MSLLIVNWKLRLERPRGRNATALLTPQKPGRWDHGSPRIPLERRMPGKLSWVLRRSQRALLRVLVYEGRRRDFEGNSIFPDPNKKRRGVFFGDKKRGLWVWLAKRLQWGRERRPQRRNFSLAAIRHLEPGAGSFIALLYSGGVRFFEIQTAGIQ